MKDIFHSSAKAKVKAILSCGQVITAIKKITAKSSISSEDAGKKAKKHAKKQAKISVNKQVELINKIIDKNQCALEKMEVNYNHIKHDSVISPLLSSYTPLQLQQIYQVPSPNIVPLPGVRKVSITIIIAFSYPNLQNDFNTFCKNNSLPPYKLNIVSLGNKQNQGWAIEECLDVQWAYGMNPNANIRVVEAASSSLGDLLGAINYANNPSNGITDIISMSWGANEFQGQTNYDSYFSNPNICYLAASGDANLANWPATSPNILACGGTTLNASSTKRISETTWSSAGCGVSKYYSKPLYQANIPQLSSFTNRCIPDLAAVANPSTGVQFVYGGNTYVVGGTSVSTPVNAGMLSIAIQQRLNIGKNSITTSQALAPNNQTSPLLQNIIYQTIYTKNNNSPNSIFNYNTNFYDVTQGSDGNYTIIGGGIDVPTGLGVQNCASLAISIRNA
jgi:subtilase family serine protease